MPISIDRIVHSAVFASLALGSILLVVVQALLRIPFEHFYSPVDLLSLLLGVSLAVCALIVADTQYVRAKDRQLLLRIAVALFVLACAEFVLATGDNDLWCDIPISLVWLAIGFGLVRTVPNPSFRRESFLIGITFETVELARSVLVTFAFPQILTWPPLQWGESVIELLVRSCFFVGLLAFSSSFKRVRAMKFLLQRLDQKDIWSVEGNVRKRQYVSYEAYVEHQKSKLKQIRNPERKRLSRVDPLRERFSAIPEIKRGMSVLCLGARHGAECEVLIELGAFAIGIDLNPGPDNRYVMTGDFHHIQFADASIDCVFTNCLEHALEVPRVIDEIKRVLKPGGLFICEIVNGSKDEHAKCPGEHDVTWWDHAHTVIERIGEAGFRELRRYNFSKPFRGVQCVCSATEQPSKR